MSISGNESEIEILPNQNKCILQFLDFVSINRTKEYLKSSWSAGAIGATFYYLLKVEEKNQIDLLMLNEIFDFKRLLISTYSRVCGIQHIKRDILFYFKLSTFLQKSIKLIISPNEFATELFSTRTTWGPRKGLINFFVTLL